MKKIIISESKNRNYKTNTGNMYRTRMVVTQSEGPKKVNGKSGKISNTSFEPIFE